MTITNELSPGQGLNIDERWFKLYIRQKYNNMFENSFSCLATNCIQH